MGKIEIRLREEYPNEFITTLSGRIIRHKEWLEVDENEYEIAQLLRNAVQLEVKGIESLKQKIILDTVPQNTIKEVVSQEAIKHNQEVIQNARDTTTSDNQF